MVEGWFAIVLFHSAGPLYVIDDCKCLELKRGITTESGFLDEYLDVFLLVILTYLSLVVMFIFQYQLLCLMKCESNVLKLMIFLTLINC